MSFRDKQWTWTLSYCYYSPYLYGDVLGVQLNDFDKHTILESEKALTVDFISELRTWQF